MLDTSLRRQTDTILFSAHQQKLAVLTLSEFIVLLAPSSTLSLISVHAGNFLAISFLFPSPHGIPYFFSLSLNRGNENLPGHPEEATV